MFVMFVIQANGRLEAADTLEDKMALGQAAGLRVPRNIQMKEVVM